MNRKRAASVLLSAAALVTGGAGTAQAAQPPAEGPKVVNNLELLKCFSLEVLSVPVASASQIYCAETYSTTEVKTQTTVTDTPHATGT